MDRRSFLGLLGLIGCNDINEDCMDISKRNWWAGQTVISDVDADDYFTRVEAAGGTVNNEQLITSQILSLKSSGVWNKILEFGLFDITTEAGATQKIKYVSNATVSPAGTPTWGASTGYQLPTSNSNKYINTNFNVNGRSTNDLQSFVIIDSYVRNGTDNVLMGVGNNSNSFLVVQDSTARGRDGFCGTAAGNVKSTTGVNGGMENTSVRAFGVFSGNISPGFSRTTYTENYSLYYGVSQQTTTLPNLNLFLGAYNGNGSPSLYSRGNFKGYLVATGLTLEEYYEVIDAAFAIQSYDPTTVYSGATHFMVGFYPSAYGSTAEDGYWQNLYGAFGTISSMSRFSVKQLINTYPKSQRDSTLYKHDDGYYYGACSNYNLKTDFFDGAPSPYLIFYRSQNLINWETIYTYQPLASDKFIFSPTFYNLTNLFFFANFWFCLCLKSLRFFNWWFFSSHYLINIFYLKSFY